MSLANRIRQHGRIEFDNGTIITKKTIKDLLDQLISKKYLPNEYDTDYIYSRMKEISTVYYRGHMSVNFLINILHKED